MSSSYLKCRLISLSNSLILDIPPSVSFYRLMIICTVVCEITVPFVSISGTSLSLLLFDKIQAIYPWMLPQDWNSHCRRHGHRNQSLDTLIFLLYEPSPLVVKIIPTIHQLVSRFSESPECSIVIYSPIVS